MKETPESIKTKIEKVNIKLIKIMGNNPNWKTSEEYLSLRAERSKLIKSLGRKVIEIQNIYEKERGNRL